MKELWSHLQQGGIASSLTSAILQYTHVVQMHLTSNAVLKHKISGHGATCGNSHNCSSFVFSFQNCTYPGLTERQKQSKKSK